MSANREYSFVMMKPDAVEQDIFMHVLGRLVNAVEDGEIRSSRVLRLTKELLREHYAHIADKSFFPAIEEYMLSSEVFAAIIAGREGTINRIREVIGPTDPDKAPEGTIRGDFGEKEGDNTYNVVHASDSQTAAWAEIRRFFPKQQILHDVPEIAHIVFQDIADEDSVSDDDR